MTTLLTATDGRMMATTLPTHDASLVTLDAGRIAFDALVRARSATPLQWGVHDCCLFAADAVAAQTGVDHAKAWRGSYATAAQATTLLEALGGLEAVGAMAGPEIHPRLARAGDVGLIDGGDRELLGVCAGEVWLVPAATGLAAKPFEAARKAWRVRG